MIASFTPGPWSVEIDDQSGIGRTHAVYVCDGKGWPDGQLARVNVQDGFGEREANARLIASVPDLLEALQAVVVVYKRDNPLRTADLHDPSCTCMRCAIDNADAALSKALGTGEGK